MFRLLLAGLTCLSCLTVSSFADSASDLAAANNRFAFKLMHELSKDNFGNIVVSPLSLHMALSMTYAGARGETASEIEEALEISALRDQVHTAQRALSGQLEASCNADTVAKLAIANATWAAGCVPKADYTNLLKQKYDAEARKLGKNAAQNADMINDWAAEHTEQRIQQVVSPDMLDDQLAMIITNAVYFLGRWQHPFEKNDTHPRPFWQTEEDKIDVATMQQDLPAHSVRYLGSDDFQAVELPYRESTAALVVFLPSEKGGLAELESRLDAEWFDEQLNAMELQDLEIDLTIPKVKSQNSASMNDALKALGMPQAFQPSLADFSGICGSPGDIYIDDVIHVTFLDIDERGTEAAAVTAIKMSVTSVPVQREKIVFHCDHPFLFVIRDTASNAILFMGQVLNPRS